jgi:DNA-binding XRE family transcriptional regulator
MDNDIERPVPRMRTAKGLIAYDPRELAAYRAAHGITQSALAERLKTKQPGIVRLETAKYGPLQARFGDRLLAGIEREVEARMKLAEEGRAALRAIRGVSSDARRADRRPHKGIAPGSELDSPASAR